MGKEFPTSIIQYSIALRYSNLSGILMLKFSQMIMISTGMLRIKIIIKTKINDDEIYMHTFLD